LHPQEQDIISSIIDAAKLYHTTIVNLQIHGQNDVVMEAGTFLSAEMLWHPA